MASSESPIVRAASRHLGGKLVADKNEQVDALRRRVGPT